MNMFTTHTIISAVTLAMNLSIAVAQPSFGSSFMMGDQKIFPDVKKTNLYYILPSDYKLATDAFGKPHFVMLQMRYNGMASTGDAGVNKYNNILQFRVTTDLQQQKKLADIKTALKKINAAADLRILPIGKFSSLLVFASSSNTGTTNPGDSLNFVKTSFTEATDENAAVNNSFWTERSISIRLSNMDAQLVESALKNGQSIISFSYAFYTIFAEKSDVSITVTGSSDFKKPIYDFFQDEIRNSPDSAKHLVLIKADAIPLAVDIQKWPALVQKIDINERMPAKYPLFDVYCYDFNQELRTDLYEKIIELKVSSVSGTDISTNYTFKESRPDVYAKSIRFPYAIRFDKPFYYRVTEINHDGDKNIGEWVRKTNWSELLDITSSPDKVVLKPKPPGDDQ
jgi:hypothetical protein